MTPDRNEEIWAGLFSAAWSPDYQRSAIAGACLLVVGLVLLFLGFGWHWWWPYLVATAISLLFWPVVKVQRELNASRRGRKTSGILCNLSDTGIAIHIHGQEVSLPWEEITKYKDIKGMLLLFTRKNQALPLFKRFMSTEQQNQVQTLLDEKCGS